jgi:hypothetical protein
MSDGAWQSSGSSRPLAGLISLFKSGAIMSHRNPPQPANTQTEAQQKSVDKRAGQPESHHDNKSHTKSGSDQGAGGGKKQQHRN